MRDLKLLILFVFIIQSCSFTIDEPKLGEYRAEIKTKDGSILPFKFVLFNESDKLIMKVENDKETLIYDDIVYAEDSIKILMPPYDAVIIVKSEGETLKGRYLKEESGKEASFYAIINDKPKFTSDKEADFSLDGKYKTVFRPENPYPGLGIFNQKDNKVSGTFRKNTGDTRYLSGITFGDSILLSTFFTWQLLPHVSPSSSVEIIVSQCRGVSVPCFFVSICFPLFSVFSLSLT